MTVNITDILTIRTSYFMCTQVFNQSYFTAICSIHHAPPILLVITNYFIHGTRYFWWWYSTGRSLQVYRALRSGELVSAMA